MLKEEEAVKIILATTMTINLLADSKIIRGISVVAILLLGMFLAYCINFDETA